MLSYWSVILIHVVKNMTSKNKRLNELSELIQNQWDLALLYDMF